MPCAGDRGVVSRGVVSGTGTARATPADGEAAAEGFSLLQGGGPGDRAPLRYDAGTGVPAVPRHPPAPQRPLAVGSRMLEQGSRPLPVSGSPAVSAKMGPAPARSPGRAG